MDIARTSTDTTDRPIATAPEAPRSRARRLMVPLALTGLVMTTAVGCCGC